MKIVNQLLAATFLIGGILSYNTASAAALLEGKYVCKNFWGRQNDDVKVTNFSKGINIDTELISFSVTSDCQKITFANDKDKYVSCDANSVAIYTLENGILLYRFEQKNENTITVKAEAAIVDKGSIKSDSKEFTCVK
jgi:hypothetical protein